MTDPVSETKTCTKCGELKCLSDFYRRRGCSSGFLNECKICCIRRVGQAKRRRRAADPARDSAKNRREMFKRVCGMELTEQQCTAPENHQCPICTSPVPGGRGEWHLDHNHDTGELRDWLCVTCNVQLGVYEKKGRMFAAYLNHYAQ